MKKHANTIKKQLIFVVFVIILGTSVVLPATVPASERAAPLTLEIDLVNNTYSGDVPGITFVSNPVNGQTVIKLDMTNYKEARFDVEYGNTPSGWTLNIGDSSSNNGWSGDGGTQSNDAEIQVLNDGFTVYGNDYSRPPGMNMPVNIPGVVQQGENIRFTVRNEYVSWNDHSENNDSLCFEYLFALNGQADAEGPVNYDIYAAFNRVISSAGRSGSGVTRVTVTAVYGPSNQPPVAICKDIEIETDENCQASITTDDVDAGSHDPDEGDEIALSLDNSGPFGIGTHYVELTVTDQDGEYDSCFATVTVIDTTPPAITNLSATPNSLWPANLNMVAVTVSVEAVDNCDASPVSKITAVESNEPINGLGDGDNGADWEITGDLTLNLRAERSGKGEGRIYSITVECSDGVGNTTTGIVTVVVPHSKGKKK